MSGKKVYAGGLRIGTRCETVDEFIEKFYRFCVGSLLFVPHAKRPVGVDAAFSFDLKDGRAALCGVGVVLEQFTDAENPFGRPGIVIELTQLQASSRSVFEQMSTMQRTSRGAPPEARATTPSTGASTSLSTPVSPRSLMQIPGHRSRAVTAAIEIDSAIAIAKENAAARSGGLPKPALTSLPLADPNASASGMRTGAPMQIRAASPATTAAHVDPGTTPREDPQQQPAPLPSPPQLAEASGARPKGVERTPVLAEASGSMHDRPLGDDRPPLGQPAPPPTSGIVERVKWDASAAFDMPSGAIAFRSDASPHRDAPVVPDPAVGRTGEQPSLGWRARVGVAARAFVREVRTRSRTIARASRRRWGALTPRRRWLVALGAGAGALALTVVLVMVSSKSPSPAPAPPSQGSAVATGSAQEVLTPTPTPTVEPAPKKKPVKKKKRAAAKKKQVASKPAAKPAAKKAIVKKPGAKPTVEKKTVPKPAPKPPVKR